MYAYTLAARRELRAAGVEITRPTPDTGARWAALHAQFGAEGGEGEGAVRDGCVGDEQVGAYGDEIWESMWRGPVQQAAAGGGGGSGGQQGAQA
jgi:hypothetical protein